MIEIFCSLLVKVCIVGGLNGSCQSSGIISTYLHGVVLKEVYDQYLIDYYMADFSKEAKRNGYLGHYSKIAVPKIACFKTRLQ